MKSIYYIIAIIFCTCTLFTSCSNEDIDNMSSKNRELLPDEKIVKFDISNFSEEISNLKNISLQEAGIKVVEYRTYITDTTGGNATPKLKTYKHLVVKDGVIPAITDTFPAGQKFRVSIIAGTTDVDYYRQIEGYPANMTGSLPNFDTEIYASAFDFTVNKDTIPEFSKKVELSLLTAKLDVTITDLEIKNIPDSINSFNLELRKFKPTVFSFYSLETVGEPTRFYVWGATGSTSKCVTRDQIKALNDKGITSYTFRMNMLQSNNNTVLYLMGHKNINEEGFSLRYLEWYDYILTIRPVLRIKAGQHLILEGNIFTPDGVNISVDKEWNGDVDEQNFD